MWRGLVPRKVAAWQAGYYRDGKHHYAPDTFKTTDAAAADRLGEFFGSGRASRTVSAKPESGSSPG
jgi:hypothetical protein